MCSSALTVVYRKALILTTHCMDAGDRVKYVGASSAGLAGGLALISHATTSGYECHFKEI